MFSTASLGSDYGSNYFNLSFVVLALCMVVLAGPYVQSALVLSASRFAIAGYPSAQAQ